MGAALPAAVPQSFVWLAPLLAIASGVAVVDKGAGSSAAAQPQDFIGELERLRRLRNSASVLRDAALLDNVSGLLEDALAAAFGEEPGATSGECSAAGASEAPPATCAAGRAASRPGNFHGVKRYAHYVAAISDKIPSMPTQVVRSIVASEWYHPGLTARAVWCTDHCSERFPLARLLDKNFAAIRQEVSTFWAHPDAAKELKGVGKHTTEFDRLISGNGTWVDVRLWRGRAFNRRLCERHFRVVCGIVEASPEVWSNPWSHVLLSILLPDSWVPFHQGHTNAQLTYHLPISLPSADSGASAELAVVDRGGTLPDEGTGRAAVYAHPEERVVRWRAGQTLVFDDSFTHAVRFRTGDPPGAASEAAAAPASTPVPRCVLLMRAWHPEMPPEERAAVREFITSRGEEEPEGYEALPISPGVFRFH